jgi:predicted amidohydrolase
MRQILNVSVCQVDVLWENPEGNRVRLAGLIKGYVRCAGAAMRPDLIVLPEFFTTGFTSSTEYAEPEAGPTLQWMRCLACDTGAALAGSVQVADKGLVHNRMYFVCPDGRVEVYDKRHLFRMSGENDVFAPGSGRKTVEYLGWRIGLNVCYDLRFPVWSRNIGEYAYDVMLNVASWPSSRMEAASILAHARAVENQSWFVFCNRTGESPEDSYSGGSLIVDYKGRSVGHLTQCGEMRGQEGFLEASLDIEDLHKFRKKFPAWMDADKFEIIDDDR